MLAQGLWNGAATSLHRTGGTGRYAAYPARDRALIDGTVAESMRDVFDIYTIIFLALAVFIFLRLRSVLGQRTGRERPPYDPYAAREPARPATENVIALPNRKTAAVTPAEAAERWKGIAEAGSPIASGLDAIMAAAADFDAKHFLTGARAAYEMTVNAYAEGDRRTLKNLLSREVYDGFEAAITDREKRSETVESLSLIHIS